MRKVRQIIVTIILCSTAYDGNAQSIMVGVGAVYGTDIKQYAPNIRVYYGLNEHICFGPEFAYFPSHTLGAYDVQLSEYGCVVHYIFEVKHNLGIYPLIGINYSVENESHNEEKKKADALGASFGFGGHVTLNSWMPFVEYKVVTGKLSQSTFSIGLIYNLFIGGKEHAEAINKHE